jgi:hypothetical protein
LRGFCHDDDAILTISEGQLGKYVGRDLKHFGRGGLQKIDCGLKFRRGGALVADEGLARFNARIERAKRFASSIDNEPAHAFAFATEAKAGGILDARVVSAGDGYLPHNFALLADNISGRAKLLLSRLPARLG